MCSIPIRFASAEVLSNQVDRRAGVKDVLQALIDERLGDEQTDDGLARPRVQGDENVSLVPIRMPIGQSLVLASPEVVERSRQAGEGREDLDRVGRGWRLLRTAKFGKVHRRNAPYAATARNHKARTIGDYTGVSQVSVTRSARLGRAHHCPREPAVQDTQQRG